MYVLFMFHHSFSSIKLGYAKVFLNTYESTFQAGTDICGTMPQPLFDIEDCRTQP